MHEHEQAVYLPLWSRPGSVVVPRHPALPIPPRVKGEFSGDSKLVFWVNVAGSSTVLPGHAHGKVEIQSVRYISPLKGLNYPSEFPLYLMAVWRILKLRATKHLPKKGTKPRCFPEFLPLIPNRKLYNTDTLAFAESHQAPSRRPP